MKKEYEGTSLSGRLKILMKEHNLTQQRLAEILDVKRQSVSQYLDGSAQPSIDKLYKLAEFFSCSADYLLGLSHYKNQGEQSELEELVNSDFGRKLLKWTNEITGTLDSDKRERLLEPLGSMFSLIGMYLDNIKLANSNYNYLLGDADKMMSVYRLFAAIKSPGVNVVESDLNRIYVSQRQIDSAISSLLEFINILTIWTFDFEKLSKESGETNAT